MNQNEQHNPAFIRVDEYAFEDEIYRRHLIGESFTKISQDLNVDVNTIHDIVKKLSRQ